MAILTSGSMAAALGRKNVGERVWWFTRDSLIAPVKWPRRPDNLDFATDIMGRGGEERRGQERDRSGRSRVYSEGETRGRRGEETRGLSLISGECGDHGVAEAPAGN